MLLATIGKEVALQHSFQGKKGKRAFNQITFFTTIKFSFLFYQRNNCILFSFTDGVRQRFSKADVAITDQVIKTRMERFLKGAGDRRGAQAASRFGPSLVANLFPRAWERSRIVTLKLGLPSFWWRKGIGK